MDPTLNAKSQWAVGKLLDKAELRGAADVLQMDVAVATDAISALREEAARIWPEVDEK